MTLPHRLTQFISTYQKGWFFKIWVKQGLGPPDGLSAAKITVRSDFLWEVFAYKTFGLIVVSVTFN